MNVQKTSWTSSERVYLQSIYFLYPCICRIERKRWIVKQNIQTTSFMSGILAYINFKSTWSFYIKKKYWKIIIPFLITFSRPDLYCESCYVFFKFLRSHIWGSASFKEKKIAQTFLCKYCKIFKTAVFNTILKLYC